MGLRYEYNSISITIPLGAVPVSKIGISGVTIGGAADYDRIAALCPTVAKVDDKVSDVATIGCPVVGDSSITIETGAKDVTLTKVGNTLNYKMG